MPVRTFDPKKLLVTYGGVRLQGFADTGVTITPLSDEFASQVSSDGVDVARVRINDPRVEVTLVFLQTSPSNNYLSERMRADRAEGVTGNDLIIKDNSPGGTTELSGRAWIKRSADQSFGNTVNDRSWLFEVVLPSNVLAVGGSSETTP